MGSCADPLLESYEKIRKAVHHRIEDGKIYGKGRGIFRRKLPISHALKQANARGQWLEITLQRTIVSLLSSAEPEKWYNEFAVSAGVARGPRHAVDIVRVSKQPETWDFIELKAWKAKDTVEKAVLQVYGYAFALSSILENKEKIPPYDKYVTPALRL